MRLVLALILIGQVCHLKGNPTTITTIDENTTDTRQKCAKECNASQDLLERMEDRNYKDTEEDKCYLVCVNKFFKLIGEDDKYNITNIEKTFESHNPKLQDMHLLTNLSINDIDFTSRTASFVTKNKQALANFHKIMAGLKTKQTEV